MYFRDKYLSLATYEKVRPFFMLVMRTSKTWTAKQSDFIWILWFMKMLKR